MPVRVVEAVAQEALVTRDGDADVGMDAGFGVGIDVGILVTEKVVLLFVVLKDTKPLLCRKLGGITVEETDMKTNIAIQNKKTWRSKVLRAVRARIAHRLKGFDKTGWCLSITLPIKNKKNGKNKLSKRGEGRRKPETWGNEEECSCQQESFKVRYTRQNEFTIVT